MRWPWRRRIDADIDQAIGNVGWSKRKPPALAACPRPAPGHNPGAGAAALPHDAVHKEAATHPPSPGTGLHHKGDHMVIDVWQCGCIHTWTSRSGWVHDFDHIDNEIQAFLDGHH